MPRLDPPPGQGSSGAINVAQVAVSPDVLSPPIDIQAKLLDVSRLYLSWKAPAGLELLVDCYTVRVRRLGASALILVERYSTVLFPDFAAK